MPPTPSPRKMKEFYQFSTRSAGPSIIFTTKHSTVCYPSNDSVINLYKCRYPKPQKDEGDAQQHQNTSWLYQYSTEYMARLRNRGKHVVDPDIVLLKKSAQDPKPKRSETDLN